MNPTVAGIYTHKGENVVGENGDNVRITEVALMEFAEWSDFVAALKSDRPVRRATPSRSMLGGVAICQSCGARMSSNKKVKPNGTVHHLHPVFLAWVEDRCHEFRLSILRCRPVDGVPQLLAKTLKRLPGSEFA